MYKLLKLNLARNALRYIIKTYDIKEIFIPYYLCKVIRQSVIKENCKPIFYHIDDIFYPNIKFPQNAYILYPNYFGICQNNIDKLLKEYPNLIIDNAHSFYSEPQGLATFNSARKFLPVYNGSYLWIKQLLNTNLEEDSYNNPTKNLLEQEKNEILFNYEDIKTLNSKQEKIIEEYKNKEERLENFLILHEKFKSTNLLNIDIDSIKSPFCYPYLAPNRKRADDLVEELTQKGIIIYRYWDLLPKNFNEYKFYSRLVPIPLNKNIYKE